MPIKGKYFPSQISGEKVFLLIRRHWFVFAAMSVLIAILIVPIFVLVFYWLSTPQTFEGQIGNFVVVFAGIYALTVLGLMLYGFVNYYLDVYIVTNKRIVDIKQNGFFSREIAELHLHQVQDVEAKVEGFLQTLFHFGTIYIQTAGERENFIFEDVPHPYRLAKEIVELHEAQIESEYEPNINQTKHGSDDYRPEDYPEYRAASKNKTEDQPNDDDEHLLEKDLGVTEEEKAQDTSNIGVEQLMAEEPVEEFGFGATEPKDDKKFNEEVKEIKEGEEVSINDD